MVGSRTFIKTFFVVTTDNTGKKLTCLPSASFLTLKSKVRAYPSGAPCNASLVGLSHKCETSLNKLAMAEQSTLFCPIVGNKDKKVFIILTPRDSHGLHNKTFQNG